MKFAKSIVEVEYHTIFWSPCVVHTLNLALKNICAAKYSLHNEVAYNECQWITKIADEVSFICVFIMNHSMKLAIFNEFSPLKLLLVADSQFALTIIMLKRLKLIRRGLQSMVISKQTYREDDVGKAQTVRDYILDEVRWDKVKYILRFTGPIYDML